MAKATKWYPVHLRLDGRVSLVVGGGPVALRKVRGLLAGGGDVRIVAPSLCSKLAELAGAGEVEWIARDYEESDLTDVFLAVTATDEPAVNAKVFSDGEARGVLVNSADDPENCRFILPASIRRGNLLVSVSTGGTSPAMAAILRGRLESEVGEEWGALTDLMGEARDHLHAQGRSTEGLEEKWQAVVSEEILEMIRSGDLEAAREKIAQCLS